MRTLTAPDHPSATGRPSARGRWIWVVSGLVVIGLLLLAVPAVVFTISARDPGNGQMLASVVPTRTVTLTQAVTSVSVESYGAPIQVTTGPVRHVTVTDAISNGQPAAGPPAVTVQVSDGRLTLAAPACANSDCSVGFTVTLPSSVAVTAHSDGGSITIAGAAGANLDSSGGTVQASHIDGPLTVSAEGGGITVSNVSSPTATNLDSGGGPIQATGVDGPLTVTAENGGVTLSGLTGDLQADTGGGPFSGASFSAGKVSVVTEGGAAVVTFSTAPSYVQVGTGGGPAQLTFDDAPTTVMVSTENGSATLNVPGGPYSVTANSGGGSQTVDVPTAPDAHRSLTVSTDGGSLDIAPHQSRSRSG